MAETVSVGDVCSAASASLHGIIVLLLGFLTWKNGQANGRNGKK